MTNAEFWLIAFSVVLIGGLLAFVVWILVDSRRASGRHRRAMAEIAARREAILAEHAAWIKATESMLDECVADGSLTAQQAARYSRFVR